MIVFICGFGFTGSGAVWDLLKEYSGVSPLSEEEFGLISRPDGLLDLEHHIMETRSRYMGCDAAIVRFRKFVDFSFRERAGYSKEISLAIKKITERFIDNITQVKWRGYWGFDGQELTHLQRIGFKFKMLFRKKHLYRDMYLSIKPDNFYSAAKEYLLDVFCALGWNKKDTLIINQGCSADNIDSIFKFLPEAKVITVKKDPRDLYVLCKKEIKNQCPWIPTDDVSDFVKYLNLIYTCDCSKGLSIQYEDLIYNYELSVGAIENYLSLKPQNHIKPLLFFNPSISIENTQLFRKYSELNEDIHYIEQEMSSDLFNYDDFEAKESFGKSF